MNMMSDGANVYRDEKVLLRGSFRCIMAMGMRKYLARLYKRTGKQLFKDIVYGIIALVMFIALWHITATNINSPYLPTPEAVYNAFVEAFAHKDPYLGTTMWKNIESSLFRFFLGFLFAMLAAVPLGLLIGTSRGAESFSRPIIEMFRPIPPLAWVPFLYVVLHAVWEPIIVVFIGVFFPVLSNVIFGVKSVEPQLVDAARTLGARKLSIFSKVVLPYSVPYVMEGITIGLGIGWMCIVAAELFGTIGGGVGVYILTQTSVGRWDYMFAGIAVIAILGLLTVGVARVAQKRIAKWMGVAQQ